MATTELSKNNEPHVTLAQAKDEVVDTAVRKNLGSHAISLPQPVLIIGTYDENGTPDAMNVAWGGQCGAAQIAMNLAASGHKTIDNLKLRKAFTVAFATVKTELAADYVGVVSGHRDSNKMSKSGLHSVKAEMVDAPSFVEFPVTVECTLREMTETDYGEIRVVGDVAVVKADERVLDERGRIDLERAGIICFDSAQMVYRKVGESVGRAFHDGNSLKGI